MTSTWPFRGATQVGARERLIFALDVGSLHEAEHLVDTLVGEVGLFKIGKQLFLHAGPSAVRMVRDRGGEVFLDLKFHDIPRTVARAGVEATRMGVRIFDLHASGSLAMMEQTVSEVNRACRTEGLRRPKILAVTVLTSLTHADLKSVGVESGVEGQVARLAKLASEAAMDGVVASPLEISRIRKECGPNFLIVTPGIRLEQASWDDQKRVLTPAEAISAGADYVVVGKPIRDAEDPCEAARATVEQIKIGLLG